MTAAVCGRWIAARYTCDFHGVKCLCVSFSSRLHHSVKFIDHSRCLPTELGRTGTIRPAVRRPQWDYVMAGKMCMTKCTLWAIKMGNAWGKISRASPYLMTSSKLFCYNVFSEREVLNSSSCSLYVIGRPSVCLSVVCL